MNLFFVGDNQTALNWGRGASLALRGLLSARFTMAGSVSGEWFTLDQAEVGYVNTLLPARDYAFFRHLLRHRHRRRLYRWYLALERMLGAVDLVSEDPGETVDRLLAHRRRHSALAQLYERARASDLIVVDGDGDIVFTTPPRRQTLFLLAMIELGIRLGKPVFLVNSMVSDCPSTGRNAATLAAAARLFRQCRAVVLRDPESLAYVRQAVPDARASYLPDSLFAWQPRFAGGANPPPADGRFVLARPDDEPEARLDFSVPYVCIGGGALAASHPEAAMVSYRNLVTAAASLGHRVYLTENDGPDSFLRPVARELGIGLVPAETPILTCGAILAHARLFISGRYHPSILASLGGTPCIFLGTHAHKMGSLPRVLEYDDCRQFNALPQATDVADLIALARSYLARGDALRQSILRSAERRGREACSLADRVMEQMALVDPARLS